MQRPKRKKLAILPKVLIVCEGEVTELIYFEGVRKKRHIPKERVLIYGNCGVPKSVVDRAAVLKKENDANNKYQGLSAADTVWAVFDRDDHPNIPEAKEKAATNDINIAFSNPNFELFLLLHFAELNREEKREVVTRILREHIPNYRKYFDYDALKMHDRYPEAKRKMAKINSRSVVVAGIENPPFCCVHNLIDHLRTF
jgi:hypothetical protein